MHASEHFGVTRLQRDDWFDPIIDTDTKLFIDPFLIFKETEGFWADGHARIIAHFNTCFSLIASCGGNSDALAYKKALRLLRFREPKEMCLGYTSRGTRGSGGGPRRAATIAQAIHDAIERGMESLSHFETLGIFNEGIGPDGISDMACTILKPRFVEYTQAVANAHSLPLSPHTTFPATYDEGRQCWSSSPVDLPTNPLSIPPGPLLFVPERFLRELPTLNARAWWAAFEAEQLRDNLSYEVLHNVDKKTIVMTARQHRDRVERWTQTMENAPAQPYNLAEDRGGVYGWDKASRDFATARPLRIYPPQSEEQFFAVVESVIDYFKLFVEDNGGWRLLWNRDGKPKPESAVQLLFQGLAKAQCRANNVEVDREVELGRGPVDFKFSNGTVHRALLEVKKLHNGKFWDGLEHQLPSYIKSDGAKDAWYLAVQYLSNGVSKSRAQSLPGRVSALATTSGLRLRHAYVDARPKLSASELSADEEDSDEGEGDEVPSS